MAGNRSLHAANRAKQDEFYTQLPDIEKELKHYRKHFRGKTVYCNCDDPIISNFFHYFERNFAKLGLKKLITTCYKNRQTEMFSRHDMEAAAGVVYVGNGTEPTVFQLKEDGDFRSRECIDLLKQADIVVTNPPFSLFRGYIAQLVKHNKKFLVIGNMNAITYKEVFPLIKSGRVWLGHGPAGKDMLFDVPEDYARELVETKREGSAYRWVDNTVKGRLGNASWFTNLDHRKRREDLILYKKYAPDEYPKYDNYDAINVNKTADIPVDFAGPMGVPISFLDKHNPDQFEIVSANDIRANANVPVKPHGLIKDKDGAIDGKPTYVRIVIRNKRIAMKIELLDLTVRELVEDYEDAGEDGVTGYGGKLDIRPPFQREFIYNDKERNAVIDSILDADEIEQETARLVLDDDVQRKAGIYPYLLTREEKHLNIRAFSNGMKQKVYEKQAGICAYCKEEFTLKEMEADHITPWSEGGKTNEDNCQMLCKTCNREKSAR